MIPAPFEVRPRDGGFAWAIIGACGRALAYSIETFATDFAAADAARAFHARHAVLAQQVDGK